MSWFLSSSSSTAKLEDKLALAERNFEAIVEQLQAVEEDHAEEVEALQAKIEALKAVSTDTLTKQSEETAQKMEEIFAIRLQKEVDEAYARGKGEALAATECDRVGIAAVESPRGRAQFEGEELATLRDEYEALRALGLVAGTQHAAEVALLQATIIECELELARYKTQTGVNEGNPATVLLVTDEDAEAVTDGQSHAGALTVNPSALPAPTLVPTLLPLPTTVPALVPEPKSEAEHELEPDKDTDTKLEPEPESEPEPEPELEPDMDTDTDTDTEMEPELELEHPPERLLLEDARSLAAAALHAAAEMQAQLLALESTPEPESEPEPLHAIEPGSLHEMEPSFAPSPAPVPAPAAAAVAADAAFAPARTHEMLQITVRRGSRGLGLLVNSSNIITELAAGGQAAQDSQLAVGDLVVAVDGVAMYDVAKGTRRLKEVLSKMPVKEDHRFSIRRCQ